MKALNLGIFVVFQGRLLNQDTTQNTIFYQAGSVLKNDITTEADIVLLLP